MSLPRPVQVSSCPEATTILRKPHSCLFNFTTGNHDLKTCGLLMFEFYKQHHILDKHQPLFISTSKFLRCTLGLHEPVGHSFSGLCATCEDHTMRALTLLWWTSWCRFHPTVVLWTLLQTPAGINILGMHRGSSGKFTRECQIIFKMMVLRDTSNVNF